MSLKSAPRLSGPRPDLKAWPKEPYPSEGRGWEGVGESGREAGERGETAHRRCLGPARPLRPLRPPAKPQPGLPIVQSQCKAPGTPRNSGPY